MEKKKVTIYKIKNVDSLSTLAEKFKKNPTQILIENQISPNDIYEGNILFFK